jgi:hypothetical protein
MKFDKLTKRIEALAGKLDPAPVGSGRTLLVFTEPGETSGEAANRYLAAHPEDADYSVMWIVVNHEGVRRAESERRARHGHQWSN